MTLTEARTWDYEAVEVGQRAQPIVTEVTPDSIVRHASTSRSTNPDHYSDAPPFAMPTQIFSLAPKNRAGRRREQRHDGHHLPRDPVRQVRGTLVRSHSGWETPSPASQRYWRSTSVAATSSSRSGWNPTTTGARSWPRSTIPPSSSSARATNLGRTPALRRARPDPDIEPSPLRETSPDDAVETVTFETIEVGDAVHPFTIHSPLKTEVDGVAVPEDEMSAQSSEASHEPGRFPWGAIHGVGGITIMGYLDAMLHRWAPGGTLYGGGRLLFKAIKNFRPGDTNTYRGTVTAKRERDGKRLVGIEITGSEPARPADRGRRGDARLLGSRSIDAGEYPVLHLCLVLGPLFGAVFLGAELIVTVLAEGEERDDEYEVGPGPGIGEVTEYQGD